MYRLAVTTKFRRDYKRIKKRGYDLALLETLIDALLEGLPLAEAHHDHELQGRYKGHRECHITPDWLLIYTVDQGTLVLTAIRTGTHADLFDL